MPVAGALVGALMLAGIGSTYAATVGVAGVNFRFEPETRTVQVGDTVRWTFSGDPHTVTSGNPGAPDGKFSSGIKDAGSTYERRFDSPGTFPYYCEIHPEQMTGTIVVTGEPDPTAPPTATPRPTARPTATPRATPRATATPRPTATARPTAIATATAEVTASATATVTASASASSSPSASASQEPSASASASASLVGQASASATPVSLDGSATGALDPLPIVAGVAALALIAGGAYLLLNRLRRA